MLCGMPVVRRLLPLLLLAPALLLTHPADAADASCKQLFKVKSPRAHTVTTITFVNQSKTQRGILWLGFDGQPKDYGNVAPGEQKLLNSFVGHSWMVATGPGDCLGIVKSRDGGSMVRMTDTSVR